MDVFDRNKKKVQELQNDLPDVCTEERDIFELCERINQKNPLKCELSLKFLIICFRNKAGVFINYA